MYDVKCLNTKHLEKISCVHYNYRMIINKIMINIIITIMLLFVMQYLNTLL